MKTLESHYPNENIAAALKMNQIHLTNFTLTKRQTSQGTDYFLIWDNDTSTAYFCFANKLKDWAYLQANWESLVAIEIEFTPSEKGNKVIALQDKAYQIF